MKKLVILLSVALMAIGGLKAQENNQLTKKQMFDMGKEMAQKKYEHALTTGNEDSIKIAKKNLKKFTAVKTAVMPIYMYNPQLKNSLGISGMLIYSLDKDMASPWSLTSLTYAKSLENSGWMLQFNNWQYLSADKWRLQETGTIFKAEMDATIPLDGDVSGTTNVNYDAFFVALRAYRKVAKGLYIGPKFGYNKTTVTYSEVKLEDGTGTGVNIPTSENVIYALGAVIDYDTRDMKQYPTKGMYNFNEFSYQTHSLGYSASNPDGSGPYEDPTGAYFIGDIKKYFSPSGDWTNVISFRLKYDFRVGDIGTSQWSGNTSYQRGFKTNTVQGGYSLTLNGQYDYFFKNFANGRFGVDGFASIATFGQEELVFKYNGNTVSGIAEGITASLGAGVQYMAMPKRGMVLRADFGVGFTPGSSFDVQWAPSIGIGRYF